MFKNVAGQKVIVFAFDSATNLPKTGDAGNLTAYVSKDYGTVTILGDTSATEMDSTNAKGYYLFDLTQAETNADTLLFSAKSSTSGIVVIAAPATVFTTPANFSALGITSGGKVSEVVLTDTLTTYTGNTVQTGDSFSRIGATGSGLTSLAASTLLTAALTESYAADGAAPTVAQFLFMIWSLLAERNISSTTLTAKKLDGSTTAMTFTLDSATTPTTQTRSG